MNMSPWRIVGFGLLAWALFDIASGRTFLHRSISRDDEPLLFWAVAGLWVAVGAVLIVIYE